MLGGRTARFSALPHTATDFKHSWLAVPRGTWWHEQTHLWEIP